MCSPQSETGQDLLALLGTEPFCPYFLFVGNRLQPPWPSLSSKGEIWTVVNQRKEGTEIREEQPRSNSVALGQGPGSTSKDLHKSIFELFIELRPWTKGRHYLALFIPEKNIWVQINGSPEAHLEIRGRQIKVEELHKPWSHPHPPWNHCYKTPSQILRG